MKLQKQIHKQEIEKMRESTINKGNDLESGTKNKSNVQNDIELPEINNQDSGEYDYNNLD